MSRVAAQRRSFRGRFVRRLVQYSTVSPKSKYKKVPFFQKNGTFFCFIPFPCAFQEGR
jgi:hypothetical protein